MILIALASVWLECWFLRDGPNGPHGWAFLPVCLTCAVAVMLAILTFTSSED